MVAVSSGIAREQFVWAVGSMCRAHRLPFDPELLRQQFPPPHGPQAIIAAAEALGLRAQRIKSSLSRLAHVPLPCLLLFSVRKGDSDATGLGLLLRIEQGVAQLLEPEAEAPLAIALEALDDRYAGEAIGFTPDSRVEDPQAQTASGGRFGFRWFAAELLRHPATWRAVLAGSLAIQLLALALPLLTQVVIDKVVVHQTPQTLTVIGVALLLAALSGAALSWARQYLLLHLGNRVDARLVTRLFAHLLSLPPRYFERRSTGTLVARLQGVETIREFLAGAALLLVIELPFGLVFLAAMFWYSPLLSWIALGVLALLAVLAIVIAPELRRRLDRQFLLGARNQAFLTEHISGMDTVKSLQLEPPLARRFEADTSAYLSAGFHARKLAAAYNVLAQALEQLMSLLVLCAGAWLVMQNAGFTIGMLVAFQMFAGRAAQPLLRIAGLWQEFQQAAIAVRRLADIADAPAEPYSLAPGRSALADAAIAFENVSFRYTPRGDWILDRVLFHLPAGSCIAIVGRSGSGKSTLARLLQGFITPEEGVVRIGGRDLRTLAVNELRASLGVVPQDTVLFSGSIFDNLAIANALVGFEEIASACRAAEIHDFIESLPQGYRTRIGEHGAGLSGGQKQRIAIARALLKRPSILVFDEATSQLDAKTAEQLAATVSRLRGRVTVLFIAHHVPESLHPDRCLDLSAESGRQ